MYLKTTDTSFLCPRNMFKLYFKHWGCCSREVCLCSVLVTMSCAVACVQKLPKHRPVWPTRNRCSFLLNVPIIFQRITRALLSNFWSILYKSFFLVIHLVVWILYWGTGRKFSLKTGAVHDFTTVARPLMTLSLPLTGESCFPCPAST